MRDVTEQGGALMHALSSTDSRNSRSISYLIIQVLNINFCTYAYRLHTGLVMLSSFLLGEFRLIYLCNSLPLK